MAEEEIEELNQVVLYAASTYEEQKSEEKCINNTRSFYHRCVSKKNFNEQDWVFRQSHDKNIEKDAWQTSNP